jgi:ppGpp synthetase/RelA/SpoT-type nucleotidyltranferase
MTDHKPLELELHRLQDAARQIQPNIVQSLGRHSNFERIVYSRSSRVKSIPRMASKVQQLLSTESDFKPSMLPDVLGFRLVTYFQRGILESLKFLLALAEHDPRLGDSPFVKGDIRRITLYTSRPNEDPLSIARHVETAVKPRKLQVEKSTRATLYSSVHVILGSECEVEAIDGGKILVPIQVEFQLRSVFEDAWGQLSHLLSYGRSRSTVDQKTWQLHLGVLKALLDGCTQYAELIQEQSGIDLTDAEAEKERSRSIVANPQQTLADLPALPASIRDEFEKAFDLENEAQQIDDEARAGLKFLEAAEAFQRVQAGIAQENINELAREKATYIAQTERAYCCLFSNDGEALQEAIVIYEGITRKRSTDAISRYRLGQALRRKKDTRNAVQMLKESITLLTTGQDKAVGQKHWVHSAVYRELGYTYWLAIEAEEDIPTKKANLHEAIGYTRHALALSLDDEEELLRNTNNFIYFGWEERDLRIESREVTDNELQARVDWLLQATDRDEVTFWHQPGFELWLALDTACRALDYLGDKTKAMVAASRIVSILIDKLRKRTTISPNERPSSRVIRSHLTVDEFDAYLYATTLLGAAIAGGREEPQRPEAGS